MVQHGVQLAVEGGAERPAIHHGEVGGVDPVLLQPELLADGAMELGAGQRIRNGHADIVRLTIAHELQGRRDVRARFSRVAELQEKADLDPRPWPSAAPLPALIYAR